MPHTHTQGKWKVTGKTRSLQGQYIEADGGLVICQVYSSVFEYQANAKLIAAAPDLLHALEQMLTVHNQLIENAHTTAEYIIALAAIQKATTL